MKSLTSRDLLAGSLLLIIQVALGLSTTHGHLPAWFWGLVLLTAVLVGIGATLRAQDRPALPYWQRVMFLGAAWGLPMSSWMLTQNALEHRLNLDHTIPLLVIMSLGFGTIMVSAQPRSTP